MKGSVVRGSLARLVNTRRWPQWRAQSGSEHAWRSKASCGCGTSRDTAGTSGTIAQTSWRMRGGAASCGSRRHAPSINERTRFPDECYVQ